MATSPMAFVEIKALTPYGRGERRQFVTLPFISALLQEQEAPPRYYVLEPEEPKPAIPVKITRRRKGAHPCRKGREIIPLMNEAAPERG